MSDDDYYLRRYRSLQAVAPQLFVNPVGCPTRILLEADEIRRAQRDVMAERQATGSSTDDLRVGLLAEDDYIGYVLRDAVQFSDGRFGLYNRVVSTGGVVVLPILGDEVALIRIFRHAARRWFLEAPQGLVPTDADPAEQARRELIEEIGAAVSDVVPLGSVYTSTALTSESLEMFAARITATGVPQRSEGIDSIRIVSADEIDRLIMDGTICGGPTLSLILRARLSGLL